jgi:hypothetical protein
MKLIYSASELEKEFIRLLKRYKAFYWTTAWAGVNSPVYKELCNQEAKISKLVVGIHFYQTHPDFIEGFLKEKKVKFIKQPEGTFHPKLYLFYNSDSDWEIIMGSANFTREAFSRNTEASILLSSQESNCSGVLIDSLKLINKSWEAATYFTKSELEKYRIIWKNHRAKIKSLSGRYGSRSGTGKPVHDVPLMVMTWNKFLKRIREEKSHGLENRLRVLEIAKNLFQNVEHFHQLDEHERKFIAGIHNNLDTPGSEYWGYFGSMIGAGKFKNRIKNNNINISKALDEIPLNGQITKNHYDNYIKYFSKALQGDYIATSTRLLAMKRPDIFYCLTSKNQKRFCEEFNIIYSEIDYEGYWEHIVLRIYDSEWWQHPNPKSLKEIKISEARAAFLDALFYDE